MKMIVYHNDLNNFSVQGLSSKELNIFVSLLFKSRNQKDNKLILSFTELRELSNGDINGPRFLNSLKGLNQKLIRFSETLTLDNGDIVTFTLFNEFIISPERKELIVSIHPRFHYLLNDIIGDFTKFDLIDFVNLSSTYSKGAFKLFKQFTNKYIVFLDDFKENLGVPRSYTISKFNERVLTPIMEELPPHFPNLKVEKIKKGRKIDKLIFTWGESKPQLLPDIKDVTDSVQLENIKKYMTSKYVGLIWNESLEKNILKHKYTLEDFRINSDKWRTAKSWQIIADINQGSLQRAKTTSDTEVPSKTLFEEQKKLKALEEENKKLKLQMKEKSKLEDQVVELWEKLKSLEAKDGIKEEPVKVVENYITNNSLTPEGKIYAYELIDKYSLQQDLLSKKGNPLKGAALEMKLMKIIKVYADY